MDKRYLNNIFWKEGDFLEFKLRDYQTKLSTKAQQMVQKIDKDKGLFVQSQAGSGKTVIMADIAKAYTDKSKKVLFLVHRDSIIQQVNSTFEAYGVNMELFKAEKIMTYSNDIFKRKQDFEPDLVLVDEAHHAVSNTYLKVLQHYQKASLAKKNVDQMFFTATPYRLDKKSFLPLANKDSILYGPTTKWLIKHHYLAPFDYFEPKVMDLSKLKTSGRDYTKKSVAAAERTISGDDLVKVYQEHCKDEQALIYASSIDSSKEYAAAFNNAGIPAAHLDGISSESERRKVIQKYREGKIKVLSNVELFTEGLDLPGASAAFLVRPTKSLSLYIQFSMRVLRYQEGKRAKIFDFAELHDRFGLPDTEYHWNLESRDPIDNKKRQKRLKNRRKCKHCSCVFEIMPQERKNWYVLCPGCGKKVWLKNPDTDCPLKELSDDELEDKYQTSITLAKVKSNELGKLQTFSPELPLPYNYQLAERDLSYHVESSYEIISEMLDSILTELFPTEAEISQTLTLTDASVDRKILLDLLRQHNDLVESMQTALDEISTDKTLKDNFDTILKGFDESIDEAIIHLFSVFREKPGFREYFAHEVLQQSAYNIENFLGIGHRQEISKIILKQRDLTTKKLENQRPTIGLLFLAQVTKVKQLDAKDGKHRYLIAFKDLYKKVVYTKQLSSVEVYYLLSAQQKKQALTDKHGYMLLKNTWLWVRPTQNKNFKTVNYTLERAKEFN